ncbi:MAG TPA: hypothetical protein VH417_17580 [Vicinamibacterales bacterium]|jgi:hypothetical protein
MADLLHALTDRLSLLTDNIVVIGLSLFALTLGFFSISYLGRRRQMLHQERMAALIKGLHYAGVAKDVFARPAPDPRDHLLRGLRWVFGGVGLSGAAYGYQRLQATPDAVSPLIGLLTGLIPSLIGLAHLLFSWLTRRRQGASTATQGVYRVANRRF